MRCMLAREWSNALGKELETGCFLHAPRKYGEFAGCFCDITELQDALIAKTEELIRKKEEAQQ